MRRPCLECGALVSGSGRSRCLVHERAYQARRNRRVERSIYGGDWPAESRALRAQQPWCSTCGADSDLTVDHPTRAVLCRRCHARLENSRRRGVSKTGSVSGRIPAPSPTHIAANSNGSGGGLT